MSIQPLRDWLADQEEQETAIAPGYTVADLVADLTAIVDGMWLDRIDT